MHSRQLTVQDLLSRIDINLSLNQTCLHVAQAYGLGKVQSVDPLFVGHSEVNIHLITVENEYAIKFFNKDKDYQICHQIAQAIAEFSRAKILVPKIITLDGSSLFKLPDLVGKGYLVVTQYFPGKSFNDFIPSDNDLCKVAKELAKINNLPSTLKPLYDPWILEHLAHEYETKLGILTQEEVALIEPIVQDLIQLNTSHFPLKTVHYDLHRDNLKKSSTGRYCLFDLETVGLGYPVMDLSTYLGLTVLDDRRDEKENQQFSQNVISQYTQIHPLNATELAALPILIRSIWAGNLLQAAYLMRAESDDTNETAKWYDLGHTMLTKLIHLSNV